MFVRSNINYRNILFSRLPSEVIISEIFSFVPLDIINASKVSPGTYNFLVQTIEGISCLRKYVPNFSHNFLDVYLFWKLPYLYSFRSKDFTSYDNEYDFITVCSHGDIEAAKRILSEGVDIDCLDYTGYEQVDVNDINKQRNLSPIEYAAIEGHEEMVSFLLEKGARYDRTAGVEETDIYVTIFDMITDHQQTNISLGKIKK
jgi:hypothetical protein